MPLFSICDNQPWTSAGISSKPTIMTGRKTKGMASRSDLSTGPIRSNNISNTRGNIQMVR